jgi:1-deoxy-D-xylulose-5-phosphate synthase
MALASKIRKEDKHHIAVIGDASIASGMAFEGLNHAGVTDSNILIVLNDNAIGIDPSVGALKAYLTNVKQGTQDQDNIFEALNFNYSGPVDGHNLDALISELTRLKDVKGPKLLHVITTKGKGLPPAERDQVTYHAPGKFDASTGELQKPENKEQPPKYQDVFGHTILELAHKNEHIVGITPAMPTGSSLKLMMEALPERAFDVGIAEQHAVTLAAGMAAEGLIPFCNIYSTFLQRAYDQLIHDVALQGLPVIFCLDRAGLVGEDGATHHGVFDISYLRCIPNLTIATPHNAIRLRQLLYTAQLGLDGPIAIRYPRGRGRIKDWKQPFQKVSIGKGQCLAKGSRLAVLSFGTIATNVEKIIGHSSLAGTCSHYAMEFVAPLDEDLLHSICQSYKGILTIEDGVIKGGAGSAVLEFMAKHHYHSPVVQMGVPHEFIDHGPIAQLQAEVKLDSEAILSQLHELLKIVGSR